jgi:hypothetical protein
MGGPGGHGGVAPGVVRRDGDVWSIERWDHDAAHDRFALEARTPIVQNR